MIIEAKLDKTLKIECSIYEDLKALWGCTNIMFLDSLFNHCGLWLSNDYILQKFIFILVWNIYKK